jgi:KRAB domain-containing zinc finger protein
VFRNSQDLVMNIKSETVEVKNEPEPAAASSLNTETTREVKSDPEMQRLLCLDNDEIKKEPLGRTCGKCGRVTMVKNHKCQARCKICNKKLSTKGNLIKHMQNVHRAEPDCKFFECDFCGMRCLRKSSFIRHLKLKHKNGKIEEFQCDYDGKIFTSKERLYLHMTGCHRVAAKCKMCEKEVKNMKSHIRMVHQVEKITVTCKICNKTFKNTQLLAKHLKTHNRQFKCRICDRKFALSSQLKEHMKVHEDPLTFQCKICFKCFKYSSSLTTHMKTHDQNRKKPHQCAHCDYKTDHKAGLKDHQKIHDKNRIKDLKCTKCDFATDNKSSLKKHTEIHNPIRTKFPCPYCNYESTSISYLHAHLRIHNPN